MKGAPATRRAYLDRALGRLFPARASLPVGVRGGRRPAERGAPPPRGRPVLARGADALDGDGRVARARRSSRPGGTRSSLLSPAFAAIAGRLGWPGRRSSYEATAPTVAELEERLARDLERGLTGLGPHLHDVELRAGDRELRHYASQGEQRVAVLSLVLAEAEAIGSRTGVPPLVLLDDVLSELDGDRRLALAGLIGEGGQTIVTATSPAALPAEPGAVARRLTGSVRSGVAVMERIGNEVKRTLAASGGGGALALSEITAAWPSAVGDAVARQAWPQRIGRDGTLHVATSSATWAFELDRLAPEIDERLGGRSRPVRAAEAALQGRPDARARGPPRRLPTSPRRRFEATPRAPRRPPR